MRTKQPLCCKPDLYFYSSTEVGDEVFMAEAVHRRFDLYPAMGQAYAWEGTVQANELLFVPPVGVHVFESVGVSLGVRYAGHVSEDAVDFSSRVYRSEEGVFWTQQESVRDGSVEDQRVAKQTGDGSIGSVEEGAFPIVTVGELQALTCPHGGDGGGGGGDGGGDGGGGGGGDGVTRDEARERELRRFGQTPPQEQTDRAREWYSSAGAGRPT